MTDPEDNVRGFWQKHPGDEHWHWLRLRRRTACDIPLSGQREVVVNLQSSPEEGARYITGTMDGPICSTCLHHWNKFREYTGNMIGD